MATSTTTGTFNTQSIGTIRGLTGTATATDTQGVTRALQIGDVVFADEVIQTAAGSTVHIEFINGGYATVASESTLALDNTVFDPEAQTATEGTIADIQAQIAAGADPTEVVDPAAAGPEATQEGHTAVFVEQDAAAGALTPGFDTTTFATEIVEPPEGAGFVDSAPTAEDTIAAVDDEGLPGGIPGDLAQGDIDANLAGDTNPSEAIFTSILPFDYGGDGPGTVDFAIMDGTTASIGQETVTYSWDGGTGTLTANITTTPDAARQDTTLFEAKIDDPITGSYTVTLMENILHEVGGNENNTATSLIYTVTDSNGTTADAVLAITFNDDRPNASSNNQVEEVASATLDETGGLDSTTILAADIAALFATPSYGADGPGSVDYTLSATAGAQTGLWLTGQTGAGNEILLIKVSDYVYEGREGGAGGTLAFTISINGATGEVTVTQNATLEHLSDGATPAAHDDSLALSEAASISITQTIIDADGDSESVSSPYALDITFLDDGPSINISVTDGNTILLNTQDADTEGTATDTDSTSFAAAFTLTSSDYGADGAGSIGAVSYDLEITATPVAGLVDSGLTSDGSAVYLYEVGGVIIGSTATTAPASAADASVVFTLAVNTANGNVTLSQMQEIDHGAPGDTAAPYDTQEAVLGTDLVGLTATRTITDGDGDTATDSETLDLGGNVSFDDDGPSINISVTDGNTILLNTQDADTEGTATDTDSTSFAAAFTLTSSDYGADGAGSIGAVSYDLEITATPVAGLVDSGLTSDGSAVYLYEVGGVIIGSTATTAPASAADASVVFTLAVNTANGNVTLSQMQEIDHGAPGDTAAPYDTQEAVLGTDLVGLTATRTITDGDGDTATDSETLDLGGNVSFDDDGPSINISVTDGNTILLNTQDADTEGTATDTDSTSFAAAFTLTSSDYGADGAGSIGAVSYDLEITATPVAGLVDSGLTSDGSAVYLYEVGGVIIGSTATTAPASAADASVVFTLAVNTANGNVTLSQMQEIDHGAPGDTAAPYDTQEAVLGTDLVGLTATRTITDGDGDTATDSETLDLGGNVSFDDDGPSINISVTDGNTILLNTQDADTEGTATDTDSTSFAAAFTLTSSDYGADGAGSIGAVSYDLEITATPVAGLVDSGLTSDGSAVYLYEVGGVIIGSTATTAPASAADASVVFTLAVNTANGNVTLSQMQEIDHGAPGDTAAPYDTQEAVLGTDLVGLTATRTITDGDGDTATDSETLDLGGNVSFDDDGPSINISVTDGNTILLNTQDADTEGTATDTDSTSFAAAFTLTSSDYGADGAGSIGAVSYDLEITATPVAGLVDSGLTSDGSAVYLYEVGGVIIGSTATTAPASAADASVVFTLAVNTANGNVTLSQMQEIDHGAPGDTAAPYDTQEAVLGTDLVGLTATRTITDGDGDTATDSETLDLGGNVSFDDDGPSINISVTDGNTILLNTQDADTEGTATDTDSTSFAAAFTLTSSDYGADGAGSIGAVSYDLEITATPVAGLVDSGLTSDGSAVYLYEVGGVIIGSTATTAPASAADASVVFTLAVNTANGNVTLSQMQEIDHGAPGDTAAPYDTQEAVLGTDLVGLTATRTITDGDGDTATDSETLDLGGNVSFDDDGPSINISVTDGNTILLNTQDADTEGTATDTDSTSFAAAFTLTSSDYGADGAGSIGAVSYDLEITATPVAGLVDSGLTSDGSAVYLYEVGGVIIGSTATTAPASAADASVVFTLAVNTANGNVTLSQMQEIDHGAPGDTAAPYDTQEAVLGTDLVGLTATRTITDGDGDTATDSETLDLGGNVSFDDDGPSINISVTDGNTILLNTQDADTEGTATDTDSTSFAAAFTLTSSDYGADGAGSIGAVSYDLEITATPVAGLVDSGLTSDGSAVYLYEVGGVIIGSTATTAPASAADASVVFTLAVNTANGNVTLSQMQEIDHGAPGDTAAPYDTQEAVLGTDLVGLTATRTITDGDGDTATDSETLDLGGNVSFDDDGPSINISVTDGNTILLNTQDADTEGTATDTDSTSFAAAFTLTSSDYGADGAGSIGAVSYDLEITATPVAGLVDSGLTSDGSAVYLYEVGGVIIGSTATTAPASAADASVVFTLAVNTANGNVTLSQMQEIDHGAPGDTAAPYDTQEAVLGTDLVGLTATRTITDGDGDTATDSETLDLGGNVSFDDDGPSINISVTDGNTILLNTQDADTEGTATDTDSTSFAAAFTLTSSDYGADGAGSIGAVSYDLEITATPVAGLVDSGLTSDGSAVYLYEVGGVIIGSTATTAPASAADASVVFTLAVNTANGNVTLSQMQEIDHGAPGDTAAPYDTQEAVLGTDLVGLTATRTITDGDGDTATDSETLDLGGNVSFDDDGPSINISVTDGNTILLNTQDADTEGTATDTDSTSFAAAFTLTSSDYGADGAGSIGAVSYDLEITATPVAGLVDSGLTSDGSAVYLYEVGGVIIGSTATTAPASAADASVVFTLAVNTANGNVTLSQMQEIDHGAPGDTAAPYDTQEAVLGTDLVGLTATRTITDGDGDTATDSETLDLGGNVSFDDDGPSINISVTDGNTILLNTQDADTEGTATDTDSTSFAAAFTLTSSDYGADGAGSIGAVSYDLEITATPVAGLVDSGLTSDGSAVYLYEVGGVIIGSTATTAPASAADASVVFTLAVNTANGNVTLSQMQEIDHGAPGDTAAPYDTQEAVLGTDLVGLTATRTITDGDGDTATDSETLDLGGNVSFDDDGPSINISVTDGNTILLNTQDADTEGTATDTDSTSFAAAFTLTSSDYGADGAGSIGAVSYDLEITATPVAGLVDSGLTSDGSAVYLYEVGGVIIGSTATTAPASAADASVVFTLAVNTANGNVTLSQMQEIDHGAPGDTAAPYDTQEAVLGTDLVGLTATRTITDGDGDTATDSETLDLGGNVSFDDDGPSITSIESSDIDNIASTVVSGDLLFDYGADDPGALSLLGNTAPADLSSDGAPVSYYVDPGDPNILIAYTGSDPSITANHVFTLALNEGGTYDFTLIKPIDNIELVDIGSSTAFGSGPAGYQVLEDTSGTQSLAVLSGWDWGGNATDRATWLSTGVLDPALTTQNSVNGSTSGWGIGNNNLDDNELFRIDFDDFDAFDTLTTSPSFDGPNVNFTTIALTNFADTDELAYVIHYTDGSYTSDSGNVLSLAGADHTMTIGEAGKLIDYVEFMAVDGNGKFDVVNVSTVTSSEDLPLNFNVTVIDADGDTATGSLDITVNGMEVIADPVFIIGSADADISGSTSTYTYDSGGSGSITGDTGDDTLAGDPGGTTLIPGTTANIVLVLDTSGSMSESIPFGTGTISRLQALKNAVVDTLNDLQSSGAANIRVHIVEFDTYANTVGTFDLTTNSVDNATALAAATTAVNNLNTGSATNYEAGLQQVINWLAPGGSEPLPGASVNKVLFISDGEPNRALDNSGNPTSSISASTAIDHVLGEYNTYGSSNDDRVSEVDIIENTYGFTIESIGINVGGTALGYLSDVEGDGGAADNITTAEELSNTVGALVGSQTIQDTASDDTIIGGDGNDLIFGDALNTDTLADANSLTTPDGAGWAVFQELGWTEEQILDYISNNPGELAEESGRSGGHDTIYAGAGDDTVYGQEGNDTIYGQQGDDVISGGSGNDILVGGDGNDTLSGGLGADTFVFNAGDETGNPTDTITDFSLGEGDTFDLSDMLSSVALTGDNSQDAATLGNGGYLNFTYDSITGHTTLAIDTDASGGAADQTIVFQNIDLTTYGSNVDIIQNLLDGGNLIVDDI